MKVIFVLMSLLLFFTFFSNCSKRSSTLYLKKGSFPKGKNFEIDTIEAFPDRGIYFLNIITNKALGHFSMKNAVLKKSIISSDVLYIIDKNNDEGWRLSKDYFSSIKLSEDKGWGWFYIKEGEIIDELPGIKKIIDSLKSDTASSKFHIWESNGNIFFNINGTPVKFLNYGNLINKNTVFNFDSLGYKLYKLEGNELKVISDNGNDLSKQKNGIYFIPSPGYPVIRRYSKKQILNTIDSVGELKNLPKVLRFEPIE